jgi:hypothetical protein
VPLFNAALIPHLLGLPVVLRTLPRHWGAATTRPAWRNGQRSVGTQRPASRMGASASLARRRLRHVTFARRT